MFYSRMQFIESKMCTKGNVLLPKRKSKSKRIQKKWNKKYGYNSIPIPSKELYIFDGKAIGHPKTIKKMIEAINNKGCGSNDSREKTTRCKA